MLCSTEYLTMQRLQQLNQSGDRGERNMSLAIDRDLESKTAQVQARREQISAAGCYVVG